MKRPMTITEMILACIIAITGIALLVEYYNYKHPKHEPAHNNQAAKSEAIY